MKRGPKIHQIHLAIDRHALRTHKQALDTARERFSDRYTDVESAHCLETCTTLRAFREVIERWIGTRTMDVGCASYTTLMVAHSLDEKSTDCLLRLQAFRQDYQQLRTYPRLLEQHHIYTQITRLIEGIEAIEKIEAIEAQISEDRREGVPTDDADDEHALEREDLDV